MKRIILAALSVIMLVVVITGSFALVANAWTAPTTIKNTNETFNTDHRYYATKGTPTIDGVRDASWDDAYTISLNATRFVDPATGVVPSLMTKVYVMWDENNLYILDVYEFDIPSYSTELKNNYSLSKDCSLYYIVLPNEMKSGAMGAVNMPHVAPGNISGSSAVGTIVPSNVFGRERVYKSKTVSGDAASAVGSVWTYDNSALKSRYSSGIASYTAKTANGWFMETAISWDLLDYNNSAEFNPSVGTEIGFLVNSNNGAGNTSCHKIPGDHIGFPVLKLVDRGKNPTEVGIYPDFSWYDPDKRTDDGYYMISDAGDLYGMALLSLAHGAHTDFSTIGISSISINKAFSGKKFRIMNDIDLNPGWSVESGKTPKYQWPGINFFADAEIDGNGKTISGLYNVKGINYSDYKDGHGFISRMGKGVKIYDLAFVNGKLAGDSNDNVGTVAGLINSNSAAGNSHIKNVSSSLIIESNANSGGIVGGNWTGDSQKHNVLIEDCTFTGSAKNGINGQNNNGGTRITLDNCYSNISSNHAPTDNTCAAYIQSTDVIDGKYSVRIFTGLSTLNLENVGFDFTLTLPNDRSVSQSFETSKVYNSIKAAGDVLSAKDVTGDPYIYAVVIKNIPADMPVEINVVPFRTMSNGVKAYSYKKYSVICQNGQILSMDKLWIDAMPAYTATELTESYDVDSLSNIREYKNATKSGFVDYVNTLVSAGFTLESQNSLGNNYYALCKSRYSTVYVTYLNSTKSIRVYTEKAGHFNYPSAQAPSYTNTYEPKMWQLRVDAVNSRANGGMSYVWLLSDGTFFIIDGGYDTETEADNLYNFLKEKNPNEGEPVISGWYFSHGHADHIGGIQAFARKYADLVDVKAFYYHFETNYPSEFKDATGYWPDAVHYGRLHTGMKIALQGIDFTVLYTLEDLYKTNFNNDPNVYNYNNNSAVIQVEVTVNGVTQKVTYLGDIQINATNCIKKLYGNDLSTVFKSDIVQFAHHGYEGADKDLYDAIAAPVVIWPINIVSTQNTADYKSICNMFKVWGMSTKNTIRYETDPVTGEKVSAYYPNRYIWNQATYVKKIVLAGEGEYQEFSFPYVYSGNKHPDVDAIYNRDLPILVPDESIFDFPNS